MVYVSCLDMTFLNFIRLPNLDGLRKTFSHLPPADSIGTSNQTQKPSSEAKLMSDPEAEQKRQTASSSKSSDNDSEVDRLDFCHVRAIDEGLFIKLLLEHLPEISADECKVIGRSEGTYNHCPVISVDDDKKGRYVVKVPAHGNPKWWTEADAFNLRGEIFTMKYIRRQTKVPVPEIYGWNSTLENTIGAPYILMEAVRGVPATNRWFAEDEDGCLDIKNADWPADPLEEMRCKILHNLANIMKELAHLSFDKMGMLHFDEDPDKDGAPAPTVGHYFEDDSKGNMIEIPAYASTTDYTEAKLGWFREAIEAEHGEMPEDLEGEQLLLEYALEQLPCSKYGVKPVFKLAHMDLGLQNIFVGHDGNITGIIDWGGVRTVPACVGYAAQPFFLREDWDSTYDIQTATHMPWVLEFYRELYAQYFKEAVGSDNKDADYIGKSPLYCTAFYAMEHRGNDRQGLLDRLCKALPALQNVDQQHFLERLGNYKGWIRAEDMLKVDLPKLFKPRALQTLSDNEICYRM